jgi:opacity protein-like surface antigen
MKKRMFVLGSSLLGLALCSSVAVAEEEPASNAAAIAASDAAAAKPKDEGKKSRGFYVGGTVGGSFFDGAGKNSKIFNDSTADSNGDGRSDAFTVDQIGNDSNFMWSVFAGYRMADWLGAEVGWTDIGGFKATDLTDAGNAQPHNDSVSPSVDGVEARLRAWVPLGTERVQGIGGLGIFVFSSHGAKKCTGTDRGGCDRVGNFPPNARAVPALDSREDSGQALTLSAGLQFQITENVLLRTEYQHFFSVLDQGVDMVTASVVVGFYDFFGQGREGGDSFGGIAVE